MSSNPLFRRSKPIEVGENPYARFFLTENPFPSKSIVLPGSLDPRENGEIYQADLRQSEQKQFEQLLIPAPDRTESRPIAFLMDYATRRGRGIGKTAFLNYQRRRIMTDLGEQLTDGAYVLLASHIIPEGGGRTRKFWQFTRLIAHALNEGNCIAWAIWRLRAFSNQIPPEVLEKVEPSNPEPTLGNNEWLAEQGVNVFFDLNPAVERLLRQNGIRDEVALSLANYGHSADEWRQGFLAKQSDYRWRREEGYGLVFDDLVRLFRVAGIDKVILLVDEVEKMVMSQNTSERRVFVDDLRRFFIDGPFQSSLKRFYHLLFTIHPYIQQLWTPYWKAAGLDRICAISGNMAEQYTIYFHPLNVEKAAVPLVLAYLNFFRLPSQQQESLFPFDREAVVEALRLQGGVPGPMLTLLHLVLERAVREKWAKISADQVREIYEEIPMEPPAEDEDEILASPKVDMLNGE